MKSNHTQTYTSDGSDNELPCEIFTQIVSFIERYQFDNGFEQTSRRQIIQSVVLLVLLVDLHVLDGVLVRPIRGKKLWKINKTRSICRQDARQFTHFRLSAYIVSFELDAPWGRTRNKYVPTFRFSNLADAVSRDIGPTNQ